MEKIDQFKGNYRFLSNFYEGDYIPYADYNFKTGEHLYQCLKTTKTDEIAKIIFAPTPGEAKRLGQKVTLRDNWDQVKIEAMRLTLGAKFISSPELTWLLISTDSAVLIEGNTWHDQIWGDCTCGRKQCIEPGKNLLGTLLMQLRTDLSKWLVPKLLIDN